MAETIRVANVSKSFGTIEVLKNVDLSVSAGQSVAILGPSGSGKSTLLHIAGLMERPTSGTLTLVGEDVGPADDRKRARMRLDHVGFLFQFHYLLPDFDALENVLIPSRLAHDDLGEAERRARDLLERFGLGHRLHHRPTQLSGGEQQRTALARALIRRPNVLLCDEPTGNLDPKTAEETMNVLWSHVKSAGVSAVIVTHNEALASQADISYHLRAGELQRN